jgi:CBS domain containing-hemolysin-like protein
VIVFSAFINEALVILFTTMFLLIFGEIFPKSITSQMPNRSLRLTINVLSFFYVLFYPLIWLAEHLSRLFVWIFNRETESSKIFSKYDLMVLVREYSSQSNKEQYYQKILSRAIKFRDKRLWDVMIPRTEIQGVEVGDSIESIHQFFEKTGLSRLPVYKGDLDHIIGFYYVLDFYHTKSGALPQVREPYFLPESMRVMDALKNMQQENVSVAVTVDEHGGTAGLVSIEDMVEKLVGAINDEFDFKKKQIKASGESTLIVDGKTSVDDLRDRHHFDIPDGDYVTIAGLITDALGRIPKSGESLDFASFKLRVLDATDTKITKVWMTKKPNPADEIQST